MLDLDAYCHRIGWTGPRAPTLEVLSGLCLRHTSSVPFENLEILLGKPVLLDVPSLFDKIVTQRRGGYCFEQNTFFGAVLSQLGFRVTPMAARMRLGIPPEVPRPRTHMFLRVDLDEGPHVVDVGFGFTPTAPLRFEPGLEQKLHLDTYRFVRDGGGWTLEILWPGGFTAAYAFTEEAYLPIDYEVASYFTSTHPSSFFVQAPLVMRHLPERGERRILRGREHETRRGLETEKHAPVQTPEDAVRVLADVFGLTFPVGTRFKGLE
jgi:N-hydroxyarylamine O-acetyltransferase